MPVLLTRPASAVARATAHLLLDDGAQVRLFGPDVPSELRARGAFAAVGAPDDHGLLEAASAQVHTLVHVGRGLAVQDAADLEAEAVLVLDAAARAGVQRVVVLSLPGADPTSDDPLRAAAGRVEAHAAAGPYPSVVIRCGLVDTPAARDALAALPAKVHAEVEVAPVRLGDVAAGLLAIDEARSAATAGHVVFEAIGPETMSLATYLDRVGVRGEGGTVDLVGRVYRPGDAESPLRLALRGSWGAGEDTDAADLWSFAGIAPQPVTP